MSEDHFSFTFEISFSGSIPERASAKVGPYRGFITAAELTKAWQPAPDRMPTEIFGALEGAIKMAAANKMERAAGDLVEPVEVTADDI